MPKEVGVLLIVSGIGGILLPGPVGTPFLLLGCLMLWPKAFRRPESAWKRGSPECTITESSRSIASWMTWISGIRFQVTQTTLSAVRRIT